MLLLLVSEGRLQANSVMQTDFYNSRVFQSLTLKLYCLEFSNVSNNHVWNIFFPLFYYLRFRGSLVNKICIVFFLVENIGALNIVNNIRLSPVEYFCSFSSPEGRIIALLSVFLVLFHLICWWILLVSVEEAEE